MKSFEISTGGSSHYFWTTLKVSNGNTKFELRYFENTSKLLTPKYYIDGSLNESCKTQNMEL